VRNSAELDSWATYFIVAYSLGAMIAGRLLASSWVSAAALCGTGSYHVDGEDDLAWWALRLTTRWSGALGRLKV